MKTKLILMTLLLVGIQVKAQKLTKKTLNEYQLVTYKKTIKQALKYNDVQTAINNIHKIIVLEGENSTYKDSLAIVYYQSGNFMSSHLLSKELLQSKPKNKQLLEINAISLQKLNAVKEAIEAYEKLFFETNNMIHGYQLANLQYGIKRLTEAKLTIDKTLKSNVIEKAFIQFPIDKKQNQNVPLKAAAYNLQGLIAFELKEYTQANTSFEDALKIMPKFALATQNANAVLITIQNEKKNNIKQTPSKTE